MKLAGFASAAVGSAVALVGFAGAANASVSIDLIWADTGTNQISNVNVSSAITLQVILSAGPNGSLGAAVSVDYGAALGKLVVLGYATTPSVTVGSVKNISAKARIAKGTATPDTTIDTTLRIDAVDGTQVIDSQLSGPIQLAVGKGGQGDTLTMNINQCGSGSIDFVATFFGKDGGGARCAETRRITKTCN